MYLFTDEYSVMANITYSLQHLTYSGPGIGLLVLIYKLFFLTPNKARTSLVAQLVKNPPAMWETQVRSLGWEDPLRRERLPSLVFWPGEFLDGIIHGVTKSRTPLNDFHFGHILSKFNSK